MKKEKILDYAMALWWVFVVLVIAARLKGW